MSRSWGMPLAAKSSASAWVSSMQPSSHGPCPQTRVRWVLQRTRSSASPASLDVGERVVEVDVEVGEAVGEVRHQVAAAHAQRPAEDLRVLERQVGRVEGAQAAPRSERHLRGRDCAVLADLRHQGLDHPLLVGHVALDAPGGVALLPRPGLGDVRLRAVELEPAALEPRARAPRPCPGPPTRGRSRRRSGTPPAAAPSGRSSRGSRSDPAAGSDPLEVLLHFSPLERRTKTNAAQPIPTPCATLRERSERNQSIAANRPWNQAWIGPLSRRETAGSV